MPEATCHGLIVVAYHRADSIAALLQSAVSSTTEVVVVNVDGDAEVAAAVRRVRPRATVINCDNRGYAASVNLGVRATTADIVTVCNDDLEFLPGAHDALIAFAEEVGGVVAPQIVDACGRRVPSIYPHPGLVTLLWEWAILPDHPPVNIARPLAVKWSAPTVPTTVPGVSGAVFTCARTTLARFPLPEQYFMYWEERDWFAHLARAGVKVRYQPQARVRHEGGSDDMRPEKNRLIVRNSVRCIRSLYGRSAALAALPIVVLWQLRLVLQTGAQVLIGRRPVTDLKIRCSGLAAALLASAEIVR